MYIYVAFLDGVLDQIEEHVARFPPERGGALLGPIGQPLVTEFIYDQGARTTGVTYTPSRWLAGQVRARERADAQIEFKGILHSHPGNMSVPSAGDHYAYADSLDGAPWLGRLVAPIVTVGTQLHRPHDVPLPSGTMSVYIAERTHGGAAGVEVERAAPHVLHASRDLAELASALGGTAETPFTADIDGQCYVAGVVRCDGFDLQLFMGPSYPFTPPVIIAARRPEANGRQLDEPRLGLSWAGADSAAARGLLFTWDLEVPDETRLTTALVAPAAVPEIVPGHAPDAEQDAAATEPSRHDGELADQQEPGLPQDEQLPNGGGEQDAEPSGGPDDATADGPARPGRHARPLRPIRRLASTMLHQATRLLRSRSGRLHRGPQATAPADADDDEVTMENGLIDD